MYESHITVQDVDPNLFREICKQNGTKSLMIENDTGSGNRPQMMTARFHKTNDLLQAKSQLFTLANLFPNVIRRKLELILGKAPIPDNYLYLEYHQKVAVPLIQQQQFCDKMTKLGAHTSKNTWRDPNYMFVTARTEKTFLEIRREIQDFPLTGTIRECIMFDDNSGLDINWHCIECPLKGNYVP